MSSRDDRRRRERNLERDDRDRERDRDRDRDRDRRAGDYRRRRDSRSRSPRYGVHDGRSDRKGHDRDDDRRGRDRRDDRRRDERRDDRKPHDRDERRDSGRHQIDKEREYNEGNKPRRPETEKLKEPPSKAGQPSGSRATSILATDSKDEGSENGQVEPGEETEPMDAENDENIAALMGFGGFDSTKGKPVQGNQEGTVSIQKQRTWRQYMNRRGGFNRPLDKIK